jgi:hypothetical protein
LQELVVDDAGQLGEVPRILALSPEEPRLVFCHASRRIRQVHDSLEAVLVPQGAAQAEAEAAKHCLLGGLRRAEVVHELSPDRVVNTIGLEGALAWRVVDAWHGF